MKTVLVFPPFYLSSLYNLPPLGLISIATLLRNDGHDVSILDLVFAIRSNILTMGRSIYFDSAEMILRENPDLVGFSAQCTTLPGIIHIAELLKKRKPSLRIFVGGHDVSFVDVRIMEKFPWIDAVVRGEGELSARELVTAYAGRNDATGIAGITWRRSGDIVRNSERELINSLDELPVPDYSLVPPLGSYRDTCGIPRSIAILEVGRGCPHQCVYCSESIMWRRRTRTFSVGRIIREMRNLRDDFGAECFLLAYDQFTANREFVENFCTSVIAAGLHATPWYCISRLDSMDASLLRLMREAGCESMCYGIDSGSKRTLAFIRKQIDESILYDRVRETTDEGMVPTLSFVVGFPEEERKDIDQTLALALQTGIQGNSNPLLQMPTVLPGTELYHRYGDRLIRDVDTYFSLGLEFDDGSRLPDDSRLIESDPLLFSSFYNLPCPGIPLDELHRITSYFPLIVNLYPKSFALAATALGESISTLFTKFFDYVAVTCNQEKPILSPESCRRCLPEFVEQLLNPAGLVAWNHIPEIIAYETLFMDMGCVALNRTPGTADLCQLEHTLPQRCQGIAIREFSYNIPVIIDDMKEGVYRNPYEHEQTILVFTRQTAGVQVTEINRFGQDLISMSDGTTTPADIAKTLFRTYGEGMEFGEFLDECKVALEQLAEMAVIRYVNSPAFQAETSIPEDTSKKVPR